MKKFATLIDFINFSFKNKKPLLMKTKIDYLIEGVPVSEVADVNFPQGC